MSRIRDIANILSGVSTDMATDAEVTSSIASHAAAADPHTGYLKESDFWAAGKNKIINGDFGIWQRGTTITYSGPTIYSADRWLCSGYGSGQPYTITRSTSGVPSGFRYYARISPTTSNITNIFFSQSLETANVIPLQGQNVILSLYYRTPVNFTAQWGAEVVYSTGTDANLVYPNASTLLATATMTNNASWQRLIINCGVLPVTATSLTIQLYTFNNSVNGAQFDITGVQLEAGTTVTPFTTSTGDPASEIIACQRYFQPFAQSGLDFNYPIVRESATQGVINYIFPVQMRATPTLYSTSSTFGRVVMRDTAFGLLTSSVTSINLYAAMNNSMAVFGVIHGSISGSYVYSEFDTLSGNTLIGFQAEL